MSRRQWNQINVLQYIIPAMTIVQMKQFEIAHHKFNLAPAIFCVAIDRTLNGSEA